MTAYIKLTWNFMDKSLFFIIGGILLLGLSWLLNRRRNKFFDQAKEANDHV
jgi:LPXTG-motif cell wall-anchored protein